MRWSPFSLLRHIAPSDQMIHDLSSSAVPTPAPHELPFSVPPPAGFGYAKVGGDPVLREEIAVRYGLDMDDVLVTSGAGEANLCSFLAFLRPGDRVLVERPTFEPLVHIPRSLGARVERFDITDVWNLHIPAGTKMVVITNLNNPTGRGLEHGEMRHLIDACFDAGAILLVDEIFREFDPEATCAISISTQNVIVTSSVSKICGMGGLRLGWLVGDRTLVEDCCNVKEHFSPGIAIYSEELGIRVMEHFEWFVNRARSLIDEGIRIFLEWMQSPFQAYLGRAPVVLLRYEGPPSAELYEQLLRRGILVPPAEDFGLERGFRIGIAKHPEVLTSDLEAFGTALMDLIGSSHLSEKKDGQG